MSFSAQVSVKWNPTAKRNWTDWNWLSDWKEVKSAWSTMGDWDMVMWVQADSPEALEQFVMNRLRSNEWVADTKTTWWHNVWEVA